jgi:DNA/RNA-binding domain of Phe-tRNA-synthetase-like protein
MHDRRLASYEERTESAIGPNSAAGISLPLPHTLPVTLLPHAICGDSRSDGIRVELNGVKVGVVEAEGLHCMGCDWLLSREIEAVCDEARITHSLESLRNWEPICAIRQLFREWGLDPSKCRPSPEALLRRVLKRDRLPRISTIVDIGNLGAIETGWPYGCYDREKIRGGITIRLGKIGERYQSIGRQMLRLESRPVFSDDLGPFGSPSSDSVRTMVTPSTHDLLVIIFAAETSSNEMLGQALERLIGRLRLQCGATEVKTQLVNATKEVCQPC